MGALRCVAFDFLSFFLSAAEEKKRKTKDVETRVPSQEEEDAQSHDADA